MDVADRHQVSLLVVLGNDGNQAVHCACLAIENLAFAVDDILLQVVSDCLADAEVFQSIGHLIAQFIAQTEEMVHGGACCKNNG